jgi:hypothetical protein
MSSHRGVSQQEESQVISPGEWHTARQRGRFLVKKVAELPKPVTSYTDKWGETSFRPVMAEIQWKDGNKEFWLPYYIGPLGKEKYGQYAPMIGERELVMLLQEAIQQGLFSKESLQQLGTAVAHANRS